MASSASSVEEILTKDREISRTASWKLFKLARRLRLGSLFGQVILAIAIGFWGGPWGPWLGLISLLPTVITSAERILAVEKSSGWHYEKRIKIDRLLLELQSGSDPQDIMNRYLTLDQEMAA